MLSKRSGLMAAAFVIALGLTVGSSTAMAGDMAHPKWSLNASIIEACSCPMFCQCYFNVEPARHGEHEGASAGHYCRANNAFKVNKGSWGATKLDGAKFWLAADLGDNFTDGEFEWAILTFDPAVTKEQREGIQAILATYLMPFKFKSFTVADDAPITWNYTKDRAEATLDGGKSAVVMLVRHPGNTNEPVVIHNLKYWGAPRNDGFVLMPNEIETYKLGPNAFEYKGTNGFFITFDMNSKDFAKEPKKG